MKTLRASYMTDLPEGDTSCTLHDGLTGGHFMNLTLQTYHGTLRVSYMMVPTRGTLRAPYMMDLPEGDTLCTLHDGPT